MSKELRAMGWFFAFLLQLRKEITEEYNGARGAGRYGCDFRPSFTEQRGKCMNLPDIQKRLAQFAEERDWDQFHSPKNLTMGLAAEAAELLEIFQWLTEEQSRDIIRNEKEMALVSEEIADVFIYLVRLADKLGVDIEENVSRKMKVNEKKYPVRLSKGNATKYNRR